MAKKEAVIEVGGKKSKRRLRKLFLIVLFLALAFLVFRFYFVFSLLLGNDVVVFLGTENENLFLKHQESGTAEFKTYILANPFCSAECSSEFVDLSSGDVIGEEAFNLTPAISRSKEFQLTANKVGKGQDLYRYTVQCAGQRTFLCQTSGEAKTKSALVTLNYDLNDQEKESKDYSKPIIESMLLGASSFASEVMGLDMTLAGINNLEDASLRANLASIQEANMKYNQTAHGLKASWEGQEYGLIPSKLELTTLASQSVESDLSLLNTSLSENISSYNLLIDNLTLARSRLEGYRSLNLTNSSWVLLEDSIKSFNDLVLIVSQKNSVERKEQALIGFSPPQIFYEENGTLSSNETLLPVPERWIFVTANNSLEPIILEEPGSQCCLFGECKMCCANCSGEEYPVILLHGHAFNKKISAEYSLDTFQKIQRRLESDGFFDAGAITLIPREEEKGIFSGINSQMTFRASYYFDVYQNPEGSTVVQTKSDSLDTYALRLNDLVNIVKLTTGKDKVIIVAHSMGGIVTRRYLQIFGEDSVDRLIMIATPNKGIESTVLSLCSIVGESLECRDMAQDSLFLNKLNFGKTPSIPTYSIIGDGCAMGEGRSGDGVVTKESAALDGSKVSKIDGSCTGLRYLHEEIIDPEKYPDVYKEIIKLIRR